MNQRKNFGRMMLLLCALFLGNMTFAQESMRADEIGNKWTSFATIEGVNVSLKKEKVDVGAPDEFTYGMLRFENTTSNDITVEFLFELQYENGCVGCKKTDEYTKLITVPAGGVLEGNATTRVSELALLFKNPYTTNLGELKSVQVVQFNITKL